MHRLVSIEDAPGYGFVTLAPWREDDGMPEEMIVPVAAIAAIRLTRMEEHPPFGFAQRRRLRPELELVPRRNRRQLE